jgi:hypothetical protein
MARTPADMPEVTVKDTHVPAVPLKRRAESSLVVPLKRKATSPLVAPIEQEATYSPAVPEEQGSIPSPVVSTINQPVPSLAVSLRQWSTPPIVRRQVSSPTSFRARQSNVGHGPLVSLAASAFSRIKQMAAASSNQTYHPGR